MGKRADALKWLQRTLDDGFPCYPLFERDPNLHKPETGAAVHRFHGKTEGAMGTLQSDTLGRDARSVSDDRAIATMAGCWQITQNSGHECTQR